MKSLHLGDVEILKLVEIDRLPVVPTTLLANITPEIIAANRDWLGANLYDAVADRLIVSHHSFVVRTPTLNILVDTCIGNHKSRASMPAWDQLDTPYLERLAAIGLHPDDIDIVMCTHLHADHVGWNTRLVDGRWVPTFAKARYLMSRTDFDYFDGLYRANPPTPVTRGAHQDSVLPIIEHGLAELVDATSGLDANLARFVSLEAAPGHSPGNLNISIRAGGQHACLCGDVIHHPIQCIEPTLGNPADANSAQAYRTRIALLERYADTDTAILTGHFPDPTAGRVLRHGAAFRFAFGLAA